MTLLITLSFSDISVGLFKDVGSTTCFVFICLESPLFDLQTLLHLRLFCFYFANVNIYKYNISVKTSYIRNKNYIL